jgi:hypothetical protein
MVVSQYFTDEDLVSQLMLQFDYEEQFTIDFYSILSQVVERSTDFYLELKGRCFSIDKITGIVTEVE